MQILSYDEAAKRIGLVRRSLERLISQGEGPAFIKISPRRRGIADIDLEKWAMSRRVAPPGENKREVTET
jgi:predicted DNA-binding transcriptional regulator AlpA